MPEQIDNINDPILDNLAQTDQKLQDLNQELVGIVEDYNQINHLQSADVSFFNFSNPFFLLTLAGMFMLAFALWFLRYELRQNSPHKVTKQSSINIDKEIKIENHQFTNNKARAEKPKSEIKAVKSSGRKINVVKVK